MTNLADGKRGKTCLSKQFERYEASERINSAVMFAASSRFSHLDALPREIRRQRISYLLLR